MEQLARKTLSPFTASPRGGSVGAGAASVRRYARICQASASCTRGLDGISVPGAPFLRVLKRPAPVRPEAQTCVRYGARTPPASVALESALAAGTGLFHARV